MKTLIRKIMFAALLVTLTMPAVLVALSMPFASSNEREANVNTNNPADNNNPEDNNNNRTGNAGNSYVNISK